MDRCAQRMTPAPTSGRTRISALPAPPGFLGPKCALTPITGLKRKNNWQLHNIADPDGLQLPKPISDQPSRPPLNRSGQITGQRINNPYRTDPKLQPLHNSRRKPHDLPLGQHEPPIALPQRGKHSNGTRIGGRGRRLFPYDNGHVNQHFTRRLIHGSRQVIHKGPSTNPPAGPTLNAPLNPPLGLQLTQRAGDQNLALGKVRAESLDANGRPVGQRQNVGGNTHSDSTTGPLRKAVGEHGEVGGVTRTHMNDAGGRRLGGGAQARARLRLSHGEAISS